MSYKFALMTAVFLIAITLMTIPYGCKSNPSTPEPGGNPAPIPEGGDSPVQIFYSLNESQSTNWARFAPGGFIGLVYRKLVAATADSAVSGELIYKTIQPDGSENEEVITSGQGLEVAVLVFDEQSNPHVFSAVSSDSQQIVYHYAKNGGAWNRETVTDFTGDGGKFILELSAHGGPDGSFHLVALNTRSNPDSADYLLAFRDARLYHITNGSGNWSRELIHQYDTLYTMEEYVKETKRHDFVLDASGNVHIVFGVQINGLSQISPSHLYYATNKSGSWVMETALKNSDDKDDAGWNPSLAIDAVGRPIVATTYVARVPTRSARYAQLRYSIRHGKENWATTVVADGDAGYYGWDGREYTGALPHLVIDKKNKVHLLFSDIASSHNRLNYLNIGYLRYAVLNGSSWDITTVYEQPRPNGFFNATEMAGHCLLISPDGESINVVGQELVTTEEQQYQYDLVYLTIK